MIYKWGLPSWKKGLIQNKIPVPSQGYDSCFPLVWLVWAFGFPIWEKNFPFDFPKSSIFFFIIVRLHHLCSIRYKMQMRYTTSFLRQCSLRLVTDTIFWYRKTDVQQWVILLKYVYLQILKCDWFVLSLIFDRQCCRNFFRNISIIGTRIII